MKDIGRVVGVIALAGAVFAGMSVGACGGTEDPPAANAPDLTGVIYTGAATDEALEALLLATPKTDAAQAVVVDTPAAGATLPKDVPPTIEWHVKGSSSASREPSPGERFVGAAKAVASLFGPREAWAHGLPVNGRAYLLVFSTPKSPELVRVFTTELTYTFDAASWTKLALTGEPVTLVVTNAIFEDNRVAQDGGPFTGEALTFSIAP